MKRLLFLSLLYSFASINAKQTTTDTEIQNLVKTLNKAKLAKSPQQPAKVKMGVREPTNTTSLRWKAVSRKIDRVQYSDLGNLQALLCRVHRRVAMKAFL